MSGTLLRLPLLKPPPPEQPGPRPGINYPQAKQGYVEMGARCWECPLVKMRPVRTEWYGEGEPALALVGEAPGRREAATNRPFVGASGKLLNYACAQGGVPRGDLAILNAIACGPIPSEADAIKASAARACRPRLLTELRRLRPRGILAVGAYALRTLAPEGSSGITALRGALLPLAADVAPALQVPLPAAQPPWKPVFFSTFHPAHIMRGGDGDDDNSDSSVDLLYYFLMFDLAKAFRFAKGLIAPWSIDADLFVVGGDGRLYRALVDEDGVPVRGPRATEEELYNAIVRVREEADAHGELSCDIETDSKDSLEAKLTAIAYATPAGGVSATWDAWRMSMRVFAVLAQMHGDRRRRWNWQNGIYDRVTLKRHNLQVLGPSEDTLLKHHAAFPGLPHRLDQMATQFFVVPPWKNEFRSGTKDPAELVFYNCQDAILTAKLSPSLDKHIAAVHTERVYEADRQQNVVATYMREIGMYIDREEQKRHSLIQHARFDYMQGELTKDFKSIEEPWRQALSRQLADKQRKKDPDSYLERVEMRYREIAERVRKPTDVGLFKPKAKADIVALFNILRIPVTAYTKKGAPITDKKAMEAAAGLHPLMRRLIHLREAQHLIATYIDGLPVKLDGRMHPDWRTNKITGRWGAGKSMNVPQNVSGWPPKLDEKGNFKTNANGSFITPRENPRSIIAAPTAAQVLEVHARGGRVHPIVLSRARQGHGRMLIGADEDQVELRIVGFLAREPFLINIFNKGLDPHAEFARVIFPNHFPQLEKAIAEAGFKPKTDLSEAISKAQATIDAAPHDIAKAQLRKPLEALKEIVEKQREWKRIRDLSKRVEYGSIYKGKAPTLWESIVKDFPEITLSNVEKMIQLIEAAMPCVVRWWGECETYARLNREIRERVLGRVRLFPLGNFNPNVIVNQPVQSYNSGLMAKAMFRFVAMTQPQLLEFDRLYRMGLLDARWVAEWRAKGYARWRAPVDLVSQVHDSLLAESDEEDAPRVAELLTACLTQEDIDVRAGIKMPYTAEAKVARRWSKS